MNIKTIGIILFILCVAIISSIAVSSLFNFDVSGEYKEGHVAGKLYSFYIDSSCGAWIWCQTSICFDDGRYYRFSWGYEELNNILEINETYIFYYDSTKYESGCTCGEWYWDIDLYKIEDKNGIEIWRR